MELNEILSNLSPINTKEKVDLLIVQLKMNNIQIDSKSALAIRLAIQKMTIQLYFVNKYLKAQNEEPVKVEYRTIEKEKTKSNSSKLIREITLKKNKKKKENKAKAKEENVRAKAKVKKEKEKISPSVSRILRTFGSDKYKDLKKNSKAKRRAQTGRSKSYSIQTENSIRPIYIPSGGMNKRY